MGNNDTVTAKPVERALEVINKMGIHARPAAMIVRITNKHPAEVSIIKDDDQVNGKSIMGVMMLAAGKGSTLQVTAVGEGAEPMLDELEDLFKRKFEEA